MTDSSLHLFDAYGIELEYMLVDAQTLDVRPLADQLLASMAGKITGDFCVGPVTWSNELALHVLELKSSRPAKSLQRLLLQFETAISDVREYLAPLGLRLLPTAVHPWMNPVQEARLWPHEFAEVYATYDRIFDCHTHGWANVQSVHLNLPFAGDAEFARLHAAVRILLPLLPALAASSPILKGALSGQLDTRMKLYAEHCRQVPSFTGKLIPEAVYDEQSYRETILKPLAEAIRPHDPEGVMEAEFLNARGAIARFDRGSIELRVMDVQEYPAADFAICAAVTAVLRAICAERWSSLEEQQQMPTDVLREVLDATTQTAEATQLDNPQFLAHFVSPRASISAGELWSHLLRDLYRHDATLNSLFAPLEIILETGTLASRIATALGPTFTRERLSNVYNELADCLVSWHSFQP